MSQAADQKRNTSIITSNNANNASPPRQNKNRVESQSQPQPQPKHTGKRNRDTTPPEAEPRSSQKHKSQSWSNHKPLLSPDELQKVFKTQELQIDQEMAETKRLIQQYQSRYDQLQEEKKSMADKVDTLEQEVSNFHNLLDGPRTTPDDYFEHQSIHSLPRIKIRFHLNERLYHQLSQVYSTPFKIPAQFFLHQQQSILKGPAHIIFDYEIKFTSSHGNQQPSAFDFQLSLWSGDFFDIVQSPNAMPKIINVDDLKYGDFNPGSVTYSCTCHHDEHGSTLDFTPYTQTTI
jgi:hypothetical protein